MIEKPVKSIEAGHANPIIVETQSFVTPGLPYLSIIGLTDASLKDTRERVAQALRASGMTIAECRLTVNLSPATIRKSDSHELAIAVSLAYACQETRQAEMEDCVYIGRVDPRGNVLPVDGIGRMICVAVAKGIRHMVIPAANLPDLEYIEGISVTAVTNLAQALHPAEGVHVLDTHPVHPIDVVAEQGGGLLFVLAHHTQTTTIQRQAKRAAVAWLTDPSHRISHDEIRFDVIDPVTRVITRDAF